MLALSKGSLKKIINRERLDDDDILLRIDQIRNVKNYTVDGVDRYKVTLSDGETTHAFSILAKKNNILVETRQLRPGTVIRLDEYSAKVIVEEPLSVLLVLIDVRVVGYQDPVEENKSETTKPSAAEGEETQKENKLIEELSKVNIV